MPKLELTKQELLDLIDTVMAMRSEVTTDLDDVEFNQRLMDIYQKLEDCLSLWEGGGIVSLPVPDHMKALGVVSIDKVYEG
jgi:hypothetical protein